MLHSSMVDGIQRINRICSARKCLPGSAAAINKG